MAQSMKDLMDSKEQAAGAANAWKDLRDPMFSGLHCPEGDEVDEVHQLDDPYGGKVNLKGGSPTKAGASHSMKY